MEQRNMEKTEGETERGDSSQAAAEEQATAVVEEEPITPGGALIALAGGLAAAILGGIIWGLIVISSEYELGIVAWGIGLLSGYGVLIMAKGKKGRVLPVTAVASSILGIIIGKYIAYQHFMSEAVAIEYGEEAAMGLSLFSMDTILFFAEDISYIVSAFDLLWVLLAVVTAWKIAQRPALQLQQ